MATKFSKRLESRASGALSVIEPLDSRQLMSVSLNPATHVLTIGGTSKNDSIVVDVSGGTVKVTDNGKVTTFAKCNVQSVFIDGFAGNDSLRGTANVDLPMTIYGGAGDDVVRGGKGNDHVYGGEGNDLVDGGEGKDLISGGAGNDTVDYSSRTMDLIVTLDNVANDGNACTEQDNVLTDVENIKGGSGNDMLVGSFSNNRIEGGAGNDSIFGRGGDDALLGGAGNDYLQGDNGNDELHGGAGDDGLSGDGGYDRMYGDAGNDNIWSDDGVLCEIVDGGAGKDTAQHFLLDVHDVEVRVSIEQDVDFFDD